MGRLNDIKGYWNTYGGYDYEDDRMWEGKFLLEKDGWFEGIVYNRSGEFQGPQMICGIYYPDKIIELLQIFPSEVSSPFIFRGKRDARGYDGKFAELSQKGEIPYGNNHIATRDVALFQELGDSDVKARNIEAEKTLLLEQLREFKLGNDCQDYERALSQREAMAQSLLEIYLYGGQWRKTNSVTFQLRPETIATEESPKLVMTNSQTHKKD